MKSWGQALAAHSTIMRLKYGRWPVPEGATPIEGMEDFPVPEMPKFKDKMAESAFPLNREDFRRRIRPHFPRGFRLDTHNRRRRKGRNDEEE